MLTANETVAERFFGMKFLLYIEFMKNQILIKLKKLNKMLFNFGYKIHISQDKSISN